jgi:hypothetical protein
MFMLLALPVRLQNASVCKLQGRRHRGKSLTQRGGHIKKDSCLRTQQLDFKAFHPEIISNRAQAAIVFA